ncbi:MULTISPECIES: glycosyltransferase [unclassified Bradyrhizobium]|uniref:glycosyltransferase n=1 Tax=unclassified Bradyrhizobium TaxID=2631580 RepID=UPI0024E0F5A1|nr:MULTISPECIES: glycosyltransferase [unclassified Bradyrhizobium]
MGNESEATGSRADHTATRFISRMNHHLELERATIAALERGDHRRAFALADRRCRISPPATARAHLLRAEALHHLGLADAAAGAVTKAWELEPENLAAARRMMAWTAGREQLEAAKTVARIDNDPGTIRVALRHLQAAGQVACARTELLDSEIWGWATWPTASTLQITLTSPDQIRRFTLTGTSHHPLATAERQAADFRLERPDAAGPLHLQITVDDQPIHQLYIAEGRPEAPRSAPNPGSGGEARSGQLTVIVPVYRDLDATTACLSSAISAIEATPDSRLLIVDDESPEPAIKDLLHRLQSRPNVIVLTNERNLGFVGAVNRGLDASPAGDVVLLNADTLVPQQAFNRLRAAVRSVPRIGTATPLSNNGEFTSFPLPNTSNPLPSLDQVEELDRRAATANAGSLVDIPNGIGFCLYLTRACLDAVGRLSDDFQRGYLEDVDLCLRAAEAGFRNVCVPSVFVGHEGSRSFLDEKRALVMRNLRVLEQRYPRYSTECAAFVLADPLRKHRAALEREIIMSQDGEGWHIVLSGCGALSATATKRSSAACDRALQSLNAQIDGDGRQIFAALRNPLGGVPQSLRFALTTDADVAAFGQFLIEHSSGEIEIVGTRRIPPRLLSFIRDRLPYQIAIADTSLGDGASHRSGLRPSWINLVEGAHRILTFDPRGSRFVDEVLHINAEPDGPPSGRTPTDRPSPAEREVLGVVALRASAQEIRFIRGLAHQLGRKLPTARLVILGTTLDDLSLINEDNVVVTGGAITPGEIDGLIEAYGITSILLDTGDPLFGHPLIVALEATGLPVAATDWLAAPDRDGRDLVIPSGLAAPEAASRIVDWLRPVSAEFRIPPEQLRDEVAC